MPVPRRGMDKKRLRLRGSAAAEKAEKEKAASAEVLPPWKCCLRGSAASEKGRPSYEKYPVSYADEAASEKDPVSYEKAAAEKGRPSYGSAASEKGHPSYEKAAADKAASEKDPASYTHEADPENAVEWRRRLAAAEWQRSLPGAEKAAAEWRRKLEASASIDKAVGDDDGVDETDFVLEPEPVDAVEEEFDDERFFGVGAGVDETAAVVDLVSFDRGWQPLQKESGPPNFPPPPKPRPFR